MGNLVGRLKWVALEVATDTRSEGVVSVHPEDVTISTRLLTGRDEQLAKRIAALQLSDPSAVQQKMAAVLTELEAEEGLDEVVEVIYTKSISVGDGYRISYHEHAGSKGGFGLSAQRLDQHAFSWEWFNVASPTTATKLQETGEILLQSSETPCGEEIVYMNFCSDVSLRILPFAMPMHREPLWRIAILEGSEIFWPSLVDGVVVPNGYLEGLLGLVPAILPIGGPRI